MTILEYITLRSPEQASDDRIEQFIEIADTMTGCSIKEPQRAYFVGLRALHLLTMTQEGEESGSFSSSSTESIREGDLAESFGKPTQELQNKYPDLSRTAWGVELIGMMDGLILGPRTRNIQICE